MIKFAPLIIILYMVSVALTNLFGDSLSPVLSKVTDSLYFGLNALCLISMSMYFIVNGFLKEYKKVFIGIAAISFLKFIYEVVMIFALIKNGYLFRDVYWSISLFGLIILTLLYLRQDGLHKKQRSTTIN